MSNENRQPPGAPVGGQFAAATRTEPAVKLGPPDTWDITGTPEQIAQHLIEGEVAVSHANLPNVTPPRRLDPAIAHVIDGRTLGNLMPGADQLYFPNVRRELARHITGGASRSPFSTWQTAWNDMTDSGRRGVRLASATCPKCRGKGFSATDAARNLIRTGSPAMCGECMGRRRTAVTIRTLAAAPPARAA